MLQTDNKPSLAEEMRFDWKSVRPWCAFISYGIIIAVSCAGFYISSHYLDSLFDSELPGGFSGLALLVIASFFLKKRLQKPSPNAPLYDFHWIEQTNILSYIIIMGLVIVQLYSTWAAIELVISQKVGHILLIYFLFLWTLFSDFVVKFAQMRQ